MKQSKPATILLLVMVESTVLFIYLVLNKFVPGMAVANT